MTAKEYLSQAYRLDQQIKSKLDQLDMLRAMTQRVTASMDGERVPRTRNVSSLEDAIIRLMEEKASLEQEMTELVEIKAQISELIASVTNMNYRLILEKRYLCYQSWEQIAADMHFSLRWIHTMHERALDVVSRLRTKEAGK